MEANTPSHSPDIPKLPLHGSSYALKFKAFRQFFIAKVVRIIDGDTIVVEVDRGFDDYSKKRLRLAGINTPEMRGPDKAKGQLAKEFVQQWFENASRELLSVLTLKKDSFGRWISYIYKYSEETKQTECLNQTLLDTKHADPYRKKR